MEQVSLDLQLSSLDSEQIKTLKALIPVQVTRNNIQNVRANVISCHICKQNFFVVGDEVSQDNITEWCCVI